MSDRPDTHGTPLARLTVDLGDGMPPFDVVVSRGVLELGHAPAIYTTLGEHIVRAAVKWRELHEAEARRAAATSHSPRDEEGGST